MPSFLPKRQSLFNCQDYPDFLLGHSLINYPAKLPPSFQAFFWHLPLVKSMLHIPCERPIWSIDSIAESHLATNAAGEDPEDHGCLLQAA